MTTEKTREIRAFIFYCSPAGSTRRLGEVLARNLEREGLAVTTCELGRDTPAEERCLRELAQVSGRVLVCVGSPVYASHALPLVMDFIARLPRRPGAFAVPFVTWGAASSGLALAEMGRALAGRDCPLLGAGKFVAVHSLMWEAAEPAGAGHPDAADAELAAELARAALAALGRPEPPLLPLSALAYQPAAAAAELEPQNLEFAKGLLPPRRAAPARCNGCGLCVENCPVAALRLAPLPVCDESRCIACFNCVRLCPEQAFAVDLGPIHEHIRQRAAHFAEKSLSEIFLPDRLEGKAG